MKNVTTKTHYEHIIDKTFTEPIETHYPSIKLKIQPATILQYAAVNT